MIGWWWLQAYQALSSYHLQAEALLREDDDMAGQASSDEKDYARMPFELRVVEAALDAVKSP
jgi:hypothetical protein